MIEVFDRSRRRVAILENAYAVSEDQKINAIWYLYFSLPLADSKNQYCQPFYYVRRDSGELYRIMPNTLTADGAGGIAYQCEHVLATLIDNVLFGYHVVGNLGTYTADVIQYILGHQLTGNWVLADCDFRNQYEYGWEQESLLSALFSVATPLNSPMWVTDTSVYPWRLSLKRLDTTGLPEMYVRRRHNMTSYSRESDPQNIVTRLYPLGYGEGVNQLGIKDVNNGVPYLQSPKAITDKYGIVERVWVDRRYEDPDSLKAAAEAMLSELQEPLVSYSVGFQELDGSDYDKAEIGKRVRIIFPEIGESVDTYIMEISRQFDDLQQSTITVANRETSIASTVADMADRQRIEQTYAQGATQIYSQALQANCSSKSGAIMDFLLPEEMRIVNKVLIKVRMKKFRAYSKATESEESRTITSSSTDKASQTSTSGGDTTATSSSGGDATTTSSSGGGTTVTSKSGGGTTQDTGESGINVKYVDATTSESEGHTHTIRLVNSHQHQVTIPDHTHSVEVKDHTHSVSVPSHTHTVEIPSHTHSVSIPGHSHSVTIPAHSHSITPGIYEFGSPKKADIYIGKEKKASFEGSTAELDITALLTGSDNKIPRGSWLSLEVRPDDLAYISIDLIVQGFIQSRGDNTV